VAVEAASGSGGWAFLLGASDDVIFGWMCPQRRRRRLVPLLLAAVDERRRRHDGDHRARGLGGTAEARASEHAGGSPIQGRMTTGLRCGTLT
jgi:hypothetical protein